MRRHDREPRLHAALRDRTHTLGATRGTVHAARQHRDRAPGIATRETPRRRRPISIAARFTVSGLNARRWMRRCVRTRIRPAIPAPDVTASIRGRNDHTYDGASPVRLSSGQQRRYTRRGWPHGFAALWGSGCLPCCRSSSVHKNEPIATARTVTANCQRVARTGSPYRQADAA
jgi:hypothetical protein